MPQWSSDQVRLSLASLEMDLMGRTIRGVQKLTLKETLKRDRMYGNDSVSIGMPRGAHEADGTLALITEEADNARAAYGGAEFGQLPGSIGLTLFESFGSGPLTYNLTRVYLNEIEADFGEPGGSKGSIETFALIILDPFDWNGLTIVRPKATTAFSFPSVIF